jgi:phytoene synthase
MVSRLASMTDRLEASYRYCRWLTRRTAGNFGYAFWALPRNERRAMDALYAFMRLTDDIGDEPGVSREQRGVQLAQWQADLQSAMQGEMPPHLVWLALVDVLNAYAIPTKLLNDVIRGVEMDLTPREFATFAELSDYCYHVAGAVGLCCIRIWGFTGDSDDPRPIDCGLAFQLTNILRDLGEDAERGRIYLPQEDLERFGYSADDLRARRITKEFRHLMAFETERAWSYYRRSESLLDDLAPAGRRVYRAMREIYGGLLHEIERRQFDVFSRRIRLPVWRKLWITGKSLCAVEAAGPRHRGTGAQPVGF